MRVDVEPGQAAGEQNNFSEDPGDDSAREGLNAALEDESGEEGDERVGHQEAAGGPEQLCDTAEACGIEYRKSDCAFGKIKCQSRKSAPAAEQEAYQQHA